VKAFPPIWEIFFVRELYKLEIILELLNMPHIMTAKYSGAKQKSGKITEIAGHVRHEDCIIWWGKAEIS
jgi:hypothetical protein